MIEICGGILLALVALALLYFAAVVVASVVDLIHFLTVRQPAIRRRANGRI